MTGDIVKGVVKSRTSAKGVDTKDKKNTESKKKARSVSSKMKETQLDDKTEASVESHALCDGGSEWDEIEFYCVKCKTKNNCKSGSIELEKDKRGSSRLKGMCVVCETRLYRYYKVSE